MSATENHIGWFGWSSVLEFLATGALAVGESIAVLEWPLSPG